MFDQSVNFIKKIHRNLFPFYKKKELRYVFKKLQEGFPIDIVAARFVGGCVRNYLKNEEVDDIDIATILTTDEIKEKFNNTNFKIIETGIKHGTVTLLSKKFKLELTTLRKDTETDGRHAEVEYIKDWQIDSERRDFTINAIYLDINGKIYDPQLGTFDLKNNNVKFIGDPNTRIEEDYLRIIRLLRFALQYDSSNDKTTIAALKSNLTGLKKISKERIYDELIKILSLKNFDNILKHKNKKEIFLKIFPELKNIDRLEKLKKIKKVAQLNHDEMLAILLTNASDDYEYFIYKYNVSKNLKRSLSVYHECYSLIRNDKIFFKKDLDRNLYIYGKQHLIFLNTLLFCDKINSQLDDYLRINKNINKSKTPKLKYDGIYLKKIGLKEGPKMGKILKKIEEIWIKNNFKISEDQIKEIIKAF